MDFKIDIDGFSLPGSVVEEIRRNLLYLLSTPAGTCAGDRSYGLDYGMVSRPVNVAENMLAMEVTQKVSEYESRVYVRSVMCEAGTDGRMTATIFVAPNETDTEGA